MDKKILLGRRLRELRKRSNITQEKLSELIFVEPATISNIENGKNYPSLAKLVDIIQVLGCSFSDVFDFEHKQASKDLISEINKILKENPNRIEDFYKILIALTK